MQTILCTARNVAKTFEAPPGAGRGQSLVAHPHMVAAAVADAGRFCYILATEAKGAAVSTYVAAFILKAGHGDEPRETNGE